MRYAVDAQECYPVYSLEVPDGDEPSYCTFMELSDVEHADYMRVQAEFDLWQHRIAIHGDIEDLTRSLAARGLTASWWDEPNAALDGKTPREQTVADESVFIVRRLIKSLPKLSDALVTDDEKLHSPMITQRDKR